MQTVSMQLSVKNNILVGKDGNTRYTDNHVGTVMANSCYAPYSGNECKDNIRLEFVIDDKHNDNESAFVLTAKLTQQEARTLALYILQLTSDKTQKEVKESPLTITPKVYPSIPVGDNWQE